MIDISEYSDEGLKKYIEEMDKFDIEDVLYSDKVKQRWFCDKCNKWHIRKLLQERLCFKIQMPKQPCLYFLFDGNKTLIYIGQTIHLEKRIIDHMKNKKFRYFSFIVMGYDMEYKLLQRLKPIMNKFLPKLIVKL